VHKDPSRDSYGFEEISMGGWHKTVKLSKKGKMHFPKEFQVGSPQWHVGIVQTIHSGGTCRKFFVKMLKGEMAMARGAD